MENVVYLIISLLLAAFSFYVLITDKCQIIRRFCWVLFYASMAVIFTFWLDFFFPEVSSNSFVDGVSLVLASLGKTCLVLFIAAGFFFWVYLIHKKSDFSLDKITKTISSFAVVIFLILIVLFSISSLVIRWHQPSKLVTANITKADVFPKLDLSLVTPEENVIIPNGGSLCGTLGITQEYALQFAKINNLKYYHRGHKLIVIIQPGDEFMPVGKLWTPVVKQKRIKNEEKYKS
jgi:hypothetical protein